MESPNGCNIPGLKRKATIEPDSPRANKVSRACVEHLSSFSYKCSCIPTRPSLVESCFNYLNSGVPRRIMFYNRGNWLDFPGSTARILIEGFKNEKSSVRFSIGSEPLLFDYLSMVVINLRTRKQRSVAWIDEAEKCFFPAIFSQDDDENLNEWNFENLGNGPMRTETGKVDNSPPEVIKHVVGESGATSSRRPQTTPDLLRMKLESLDRGSESFLRVQKQFLSGMGPFASSGNVLYIYQYVPKDNAGKQRKDTFEQIIRLTEEKRGNPNVRYAWFGAKKLDTAGVLIHGFGIFGKPTEGVLGTGLYVSPEGRSFASVNLCDVDEKGLQYMILCRVILGNMEQVHPGSKQYFPSCGDYDSGVDDLSNPKCFVVWPSYITTNIHPEYLVCFRLAPNVQEYLFGLKDLRFHLPNPAPDNSTLHPLVVHEPMKGPTSPWVPFPVLFEAIQDHVSPLAMELMFNHYQEMKNKLITREELVKKVRMIIGDQMLASVLAKFKREPSLWYEGPLSNKMKHQETTSSQLNPDDNNQLNAEGNSSMEPRAGPNAATHP